MAASQTLQNTTLDHGNGKAAWTLPTAGAVAILESSPTPTTSWAALNRAGYTGYADAPTTPADWNNASMGTPGQADNGSEIAFPQSTAVQSTVTHAAVRYGTTENYVYGPLTAPVTIDPGETPRFSAGALIQNVT